MKVGVSIYSFHEYVGQLGLIGVLDKIKEFGGEAVDFIPFVADNMTKYGGFTPEKGDETYRIAKDLKAHMDEIGLEPGCYCLSCSMITADIEEEIKRVCAHIDVAKELGCKVVRIDVCNGFPAEKKLGRDYDSFIKVGVEPIRRIADYAQEQGIMLCTENHGKFSQDAERVEKLINTVNHPNFMALVDIGNFLSADGDPGKSTGLLAQYAVHAHAKDFFIRSGALEDPGEGWGLTRGGNYIRGTIIGHGVVPVKSCLKLLKNAGYDGILAIEFEGKEDPLFGIRVGIANLKRFLSQI